MPLLHKRACDRKLSRTGTVDMDVGMEQMPNPSCSDEEDGCLGWARTGECEKNPAFMNAACRRSCGTCAQFITVRSCLPACLLADSMLSKPACTESPKPVQTVMHVCREASTSERTSQ